MALPRFFALLIGLLTALYFGVPLYRGAAEPVPFIIMCVGGGILILIALRRAERRAHRLAVAGGWALYSLLCLGGLAGFILLGGEARDKALVLLLFFIGLMLTGRAGWQATRRKRHKWDSYFDK